MDSLQLLDIDPHELKFPFELNKQISCSLQLRNKTDNHIAFKVKTTNPKKYCVKPNFGIVLPKSTCDIIVTMQSQKEAPSDLQCKDKFLLQSVVAAPNVALKDINNEMFNRQAGHFVEECKLRVAYGSPPQPPSPISEGSEEDSSPKDSTQNSRKMNVSALTVGAKSSNESQDKPFEEKSEIMKLMEEKEKATKLSNNLRHEMEVLKNKSSSGFPLIFVFLVGVLGSILGYLARRS